MTLAKGGIKRALESWRSLVGGLFFLFLGLAFLFVSSLMLLEEITWRQCAKWPTTDGVMTEAARGGVPERGYDYFVDGATLHGYRLYKGTFTSTKEDTRAVLDRCPPGKSVLVHYNPKHPEQSFLERADRGVGVVALMLPFVALAAIFVLGREAYKASKYVISGNRRPWRFLG